MNTNVSEYYGLQQPSPQIDPVFYVLYYTVVFALTAVTLISMWKVFKKAGRSGWEAIIPLYNLYVLIQISGKPGWWFVLYLIPFANVVVSLLVSINLGRMFGKSTLFSVVFLWFFSVVGYLILAFGQDTYGGNTDSVQPQPPTSQQPENSTSPSQPQAQPTTAPAPSSQQSSTQSDITPLDKQSQSTSSQTKTPASS